LDVDDSHLDQLMDGRPLVSEESETLSMLLYRAPRYPNVLWERWCQQPLDVAAVKKSPKDFHVHGVLIQGRAKQVEVVQLLPEQAPLYEFGKYYRVTIAVEGAMDPFVVNTRSIPKAWKDVQELDEPVRVRALFLKTGETADDRTPLYFVAARIGWFPDQENEAFGVNGDLVWLAKQGMDVALWDDVVNGSSIGAAEGECFYQLLATLKRVKPEAARTFKAKPFDLPAMLTTPDTLLGHAYDVTATARRVQKVAVPEEFRERLGIDHYYEIDLLIPLENQAIKLSTGKGKKDAPTFRDGFPITFNVIRVPDDLELDKRIAQRVRLKGTFFKLWAFQSDFVKKYGEDQRQPSPLLFGIQPTVIAPDEPQGAFWGPTVIMSVIIAGVGIVWFVAWRIARGDNQFDRQVLRKYATGEKSGGGKFQMPAREQPPEQKPE
jgi:hypothetical protein